jgi:hypothetical protein
MKRVQAQRPRPFFGNAAFARASMLESVIFVNIVLALSESMPLGSKFGCSRQRPASAAVWSGFESKFGYVSWQVDNKFSL